MTDIPADIEKAARHLAEMQSVWLRDDPVSTCAMLIGLAVTAERETCAKIVENWQEQLRRGEFIPTAIERLASAIRSERAGG